MGQSEYKRKSNKLCCVTSKGVFFLFSLERNRFKLLLVYKSKYSSYLNSHQILFHPEKHEPIQKNVKLRDLPYRKSDKQLNRTKQILCLYKSGILIKEDLTLRKSIVNHRKISKDILSCFTRYPNDGNEEEFLNLKLVSTKSAISDLIMPKNGDFTKMKKIQRHGNVTSAFGTYKVESIQNLDLSGIETSKKFTTQQKQ